ncbi:MAG: GNAT family N-acetyltransferase [Lysinibacillus sp.]
MAIFEGTLGDKTFTVRRLSIADLEAIEGVQYDVVAALEDKRILQPLSGEELEYLLGNHGVMIGAFVGEELIAFRALLEPPIDEEHLGRDAGLAEEALVRVMYQEISAVHPSYRGYGLQRTLADVIMKELDRTQFDYVCATVMPFNIASLKDKFAQGMHVVALKLKYEGKLRYVFMKNLREEMFVIEGESQLVAMANTERQQQLLKDGWLGVRLLQHEDIWHVEYQKRIVE